MERASRFEGERKRRASRGDEGVDLCGKGASLFFIEVTKAQVGD